MPSIFSQESFPRARTPSWVHFPERSNSGSGSDEPGPLFTPSSHNELSVISVVYGSYYDTEKLPTARPRRRSETSGRTGRAGQNNRRLIIVDNNLVSRDPQAPPDDVEAHTSRRAEAYRLARDTLARRVDVGATTANKEVEKPPPVGQKERSAVFKVICPDTSDLWKMVVIPGETLDGFASRVKEKTGGEVILLMDGEVLASEEDWQAAKGGGRIVAHLIR